MYSEDDLIEEMWEADAEPLAQRQNLGVGERLQLGPASVERLPGHVQWVAGAAPRGRRLGNDPRHVDLPVHGLSALDRGGPLVVSSSQTHQTERPWAMTRRSK